MCFIGTALHLEVGSRIRASTGVVVLLEIRLEGRSTRAILLLVSEGRSSSGHEVVIVLVDTRLALLQAPEDEGDTTKEEGTAYSTDHATNNLLVGITETASIIATVRLRRGWIGDDSLAGRGDDTAGTG